jgi:hypothetical protein
VLTRLRPEVVADAAALLEGEEPAPA